MSGSSIVPQRGIRRPSTGCALSKTRDQPTCKAAQGWAQIKLLGRGLGGCPHWGCSEHLGPFGCFGKFLFGFFHWNLKAAEVGSWRSGRTMCPWGEWQLGGLFPLHAALPAVWMRANDHHGPLFFALVWLSGLSGILNISTADFGAGAKKQSNQKLCLLFLSSLKCFS